MTPRASAKYNGLSVRLGPAPGSHVDASDYNAKNIGRDEAQLCGSESDDADDRAIHAGQDPTFPTATPQQHSRYNSQHARKIIKPQHVGRTSDSIVSEECGF